MLGPTNQRVVLLCCGCGSPWSLIDDHQKGVRGAHNIEGVYFIGSHGELSPACIAGRRGSCSEGIEHKELVNPLGQKLGFHSYGQGWIQEFNFACSKITNHSSIVTFFCSGLVLVFKNSIVIIFFTNETNQMRIAECTQLYLSKFKRKLHMYSYYMSTSANSDQ